MLLDLVVDLSEDQKLLEEDFHQCPHLGKYMCVSPCSIVSILISVCKETKCFKTTVKTPTLISVQIPIFFYHPPSNCAASIKLQPTSVITNPDITNFGSSELFLVVLLKQNLCLFIIIYFGYNELRLYRTDFAGPLGVRYNRSRL